MIKQFATFQIAKGDGESQLLFEVIPKRDSQEEAEKSLEEFLDNLKSSGGLKEDFRFTILPVYKYSKKKAVKP